MRFLALVIIFISVTAQAESKRPKSFDKMMRGNPSTRHEFNDLSVRGRYQSGFEGVATIENEKELENLLDYRSEFKDKISGSARYQIRPN